MWEKIDNLIFLIVGILLILFRKEFARFVMWYHRRRWHRRKQVKNGAKEYSKEAWSAGERFAQVLTIVVGSFFVILSLLSLLGILKEKP